MGNIFRKLESARKHAFDSLRYFPEHEKNESISEDSSLKEVVNVIDDDDNDEITVSEERGKSVLVNDRVRGEVRKVGKSELLHGEKFVDLSSDGDEVVDVSDVVEYRKLLESAERESGRYRWRESEIRLSEGRLSSYESLALTKPKEEDYVEVRNGYP